MKQGELSALVDGIAPVITRLMADAYSKIDERIKTVEARLSAIPVPLKGDPGKDAEVNEEQVADAVKAYFADNPIPVPQDGKSVTADEVLPQLQAELIKAIEALPKPVNGKDAEVTDEQLSVAVEKYLELNPPDNGKNAYEVAVSLGFQGDVYKWLESMRGPPGIAVDGKSVTADEVLPELKAELREAIAAIPLPKDGKDSDVTAEDFRTLFEAEQAKALLDFERRLDDRLQRAVDRIKPKDGRDGFGFDDMDVLYDGERTVTIRFARGELVKEFPFKLPVPIDRGVWKSGQKYERGDSVSFGGSTFIAQRDTDSKPETDDSFRLSVKRGRDGKDATVKVQRADPEPMRADPEPIRLR